jgi:hypothetical protein
VTEDRRRTLLLLGAIVGAAGLAVGAWMMSRRNNGKDGKADRTVSDVLSDCYDKMREIQSHLSELGPALSSPVPERA